MRIHWRTMNEDDHKETAKLKAHSKVGSLLKTQQTFSVILQKTPCMTGFFTRLMEMAIHSMKILIRGRS